MDTQGDTGQATHDDARWHALAFRLGEEELLVPSESIAEVLDPPEPLTRVPGAPAWVDGVAAIRGVITLVVDLAGVLGIAAPGAGRGRRLLLAHATESALVGLLVTDVLGTRELAGEPQSAIAAEADASHPALRSCAGPEGGVHRLLDVATLLRSEAFRTVRP